MSTETVQAITFMEAVRKLLSGGALDELANLLIKIPALIIAIGAWAIELFVWMIFELVVKLVHDLFDPIYYRDILKGFAINPMVRNGWKVVASICNMFYIIVLLFIGVGTLFRIEKYNYKKLLVKLVVVALLTNFSLVFAGLILDFFHVLMFNGIFGHPLEEVEKAIKGLLWGPSMRRWDTIKHILDAPDLATIAAITAGAVAPLIFIAMTAIVVLSVGIFLIIRTVALWVLLVLSPIAYIGLVLPDTEGTAKKWWGSFLKYAMAGPILFFFLWFSANTMNLISGELVVSNPKNDLTDMDLGNGKTLGDKKYVEPIVASHNIYMYLMFSSILLWGSIIAAASLSIAGASKVTRMAQIAVVGGSMALHKIGLHGTKTILKGAGERLKQVTPPEALRDNAGLWERTKARARKMAPGMGKGLVGASGAAKTMAMLEPVTLGRGLYGAYKKTMDAQGKEDTESLSQLGSLTWLAMTNQSRRLIGMTPKTQIAGDAEDKKRAAARAKNEKGKNDIDEEDTELGAENQSLIDEENQRRGTPFSEERMAEIADRKNEIANRRQKLQEQRGTLETEWTTNNLAENFDAEYRKAAKREVYGEKYRSFFHDDRVHQQKVATATERMTQETKTPSQLITRVGNGTSPADIEAGLRLMAKKGMNITNELQGAGFIDSNATLNDFIDEKFKGNSKRPGDLLRVDLDNIARENKHYNEAGTTIMDSKTKQMRSATSEERVHNIDEMLSNLSSRNYARTFKANLIVKTLPDGTKKLADTAHVTIKNMDNNFVETQQRFKVIPSKDIKELKKLVKNTEVTNQLSTEEKRKINEVINVSARQAEGMVGMMGDEDNV
ncbi:MAG: hypothetical protein U9Q72_01810 [Patescibacteria group bacterium]|nr:hypothetical protein [Patescibacteria group bacterium]